MFEKFLDRELAEIKKNKSRIFGLAVCLIFAVIFALWDDDSGEEIILEEVPPAEEKISEEKVPPAEKNSDENIKIVSGANSEILFVRDPFKINLGEEIEEEEKIPETPKVEEKFSLPVMTSPILPQKISPPPTEKIILAGTAVGATEKTAIIRREKSSGSEEFILTIGDTLGGKKIIEITENSLTLEDGEKLYIN